MANLHNLQPEKMFVSVQFSFKQTKEICGNYVGNSLECNRPSTCGCSSLLSMTKAKQQIKVLSKDTKTLPFCRGAVDKGNVV